MTNSNNKEQKRPKGLQVNSKAPSIDTIDIYNKPVKLDELLEIYNGVLIDFFRGNW
ncbi:MAG: hypothetical protein ACFFEY_03410 [Candidatus Thorarchaeota archaeon]